METETVRLNITLPRKLAQDLERVTGPRKRSRFIAEAIKRKIEELRKQKLNELLVEGYKATREEGLSLTKEFEDADLEGWDEY